MSKINPFLEPYPSSAGLVRARALYFHLLKSVPIFPGMAPHLLRMRRLPKIPRFDQPKWRTRWRHLLSQLLWTQIRTQGRRIWHGCWNAFHGLTWAHAIPRYAYLTHKDLRYLLESGEKNEEASPNIYRGIEKKTFKEYMMEDDWKWKDTTSTEGYDFKRR